MPLPRVSFESYRMSLGPRFFSDAQGLMLQSRRYPACVLWGFFVSGLQLRCSATLRFACCSLVCYIAISAMALVFVPSHICVRFFLSASFWCFFLFLCFFYLLFCYFCCCFFAILVLFCVSCFFLCFLFVLNKWNFTSEPVFLFISGII